MKRSSALVLSLVLLGGAGILLVRLMLDNYALKVELARVNSSRSHAAATPPPPPVAAAAPRPVAASGREVIESARQLMMDALSAETDPDRKLWLRVDPRDAEASAFARQIAAVFRESGWAVEELDNEGLRFKPGLLMLVGAEDEPPAYVLAAQKAIEAIGQDLSTGRGYRSYYEAKKKESAQWQGTRFLPDQTYVVLVGRRPEPQAAAE
jgi:hypothetical protein